MEEKQFKMKPKTLILIIIAIFVIGIIWFINRSYGGEHYKMEYNDMYSMLNLKELDTSDYRQIDENSFKFKNKDYIIINSYNDYLEYNYILRETRYSDTEPINKIRNTFNREFFNNNSLILIDYFSPGSPNLDTRLLSVNINKTEVNVNMYVKSSGFTADKRGDIYFIPIKNKNITEVCITSSDTNMMTIINVLLISSPFIILGLSIYRCIAKKKKIDNEIQDAEQKKKLKFKANIGLIVWIILSIFWFLFLQGTYTMTNNVAYKPIIYLYPTEETEISVILGNSEKLTHTYPKYNNSWNVIAKPNGNLIDIKTGRSLYSLYWEGINSVKPNMSEGFIVKGEDTIPFLEEKLAILGLTEREANEFIIYWLPQLENNKYNFIRFQTIEEINSNMPLEVIPTPNTIIRIMMEFKELDKEITVKEQRLKTPQRNGFVIVEWGGTEII